MLSPFIFYNGNTKIIGTRVGDNEWRIVATHHRHTPLGRVEHEEVICESCDNATYSQFCLHLIRQNGVKDTGQPFLVLVKELIICINESKEEIL